MRMVKAASDCACSTLMATETEDLDAEISREIQGLKTSEITSRAKLMANEIRILKVEVERIEGDINGMIQKIKEYQDKINSSKVMPYLVSTVIEVLDIDPDTSGVHKDSYYIIEKLPVEYDSRVKIMEVDERPTEDYNDIGGLDKQIQQLIEAIVLPMTHEEKFIKLGIQPPKGVLLYGPPGTGKTLLARACAAQTKATFLKLAGPQLVQMFIGDGAKIVRDTFALAKEKAPTIIFIDELDAIGTKRFDSEKTGDREVQRTMLELLNQLDGFTPNNKIKIIAATNRIDILDPALLRSGRIDSKIEFLAPNEESRITIFQIHSRKMNVDSAVNFRELSRSTTDFNGAQLKAVCGMAALRRRARNIVHEDFVEGRLLH
ncbi:hypothetical protein HZS_178 [Henneguya salminicola]|nr:hypothetical protein HZS_178 [Henneguya salminicola]